MPQNDNNSKAVSQLHQGGQPGQAIKSFKNVNIAGEEVCEGEYEVQQRPGASYSSRSSFLLFNVPQLCCEPDNLAAIDFELKNRLTCY